jgi:hypothetical protein
MVAIGVGVGLAVLGGLLAWGGRSAGAAIRGFNRRALTTTGSVVAVHSHRSTSGSFHRTIHVPEVEFVDQRGRSHRARGGGHSEPPPIGTTMRLMYDPRDPKEVSFRGRRGQAGIAPLLVAVGLALALCGLGLASYGVFRML